MDDDLVFLAHGLRSLNGRLDIEKKELINFQTHFLTPLCMLARLKILKLHTFLLISYTAIFQQKYLGLFLLILLLFY
jgi:hypothetical protein